MRQVAENAEARLAAIRDHCDRGLRYYAWALKRMPSIPEQVDSVTQVESAMYAHAIVLAYVEAKSERDALWAVGQIMQRYSEAVEAEGWQPSFGAKRQRPDGSKGARHAQLRLCDPARPLTGHMALGGYVASRSRREDGTPVCDARRSDSVCCSGKPIGLRASGAGPKKPSHSTCPWWNGSSQFVRTQDLLLDWLELPLHCPCSLPSERRYRISRGGAGQGPVNRPVLGRQLEEEVGMPSGYQWRDRDADAEILTGSGTPG
jgi:hypothetical protein